MKCVQKSEASQLPQILWHLGQLGSEEGGARLACLLGWRGGCLRRGWAPRGLGGMARLCQLPCPHPAGLRALPPGARGGGIFDLEGVAQ